MSSIQRDQKKGYRRGISPSAIVVGCAAAALLALSICSRKPKPEHIQKERIVEMDKIKKQDVLLGKLKDKKEHKIRKDIEKDEKKKDEIIVPEITLIGGTEREGGELSRVPLDDIDADEEKSKTEDNKTEDDVCVPERLHWKFDQTSGDALDSSGNGFNGKNLGVTYKPGRMGNAAYFDGKAVLLSVPESMANLPEGSVSFWVKLKSDEIDYNLLWLGLKLPDDRNLFFARIQYDGERVNKEIYKLGGGRWNLVLNNGHFLFASGSFIPVGEEWHHVVITWDKIEAKLYVNGLRLDTLGNLTESGIPNVAQIKIPEYSADAQFKPNSDYLPYLLHAWWGRHYIHDREGLEGFLDDLRVFAKALSDRRVKKLYNNGAGTEDALCAK